MKKFFKLLQKDSVLTWTFWTTVLAIIVSLGVIALFYTNLPPFLPLYNQMPWGYERLGKTEQLFLFPLLAFFISALNLFFGVKLLEKNPLLARFLFITMTVISLFTCIFVTRLIFLVL